MYQLYSLLLTLGFFILLPRFVFDALRHGKYVAGFRERLGSLQTSPFTQPVIWFHCVSVGETQAARPLVDLIHRQFPEHSLVVSTITLTGQKLARQVFANTATRIFYFPFDWRWTVRRTLKTINPAAVLLMETELWPNFLHECSERQISVALVNGRISSQSLRRYRLFRNFFRHMLANLDVAVMQTEADANRLSTLGFPTDKLYVSGNVKFDAGTMMAAASVTEMLCRKFGLTKDIPVILAASTHEPEEEMMLQSFQQLRRQQEQVPRLILAPRHPERFREVASLLESSGLKWVRRTASESESDKQCDVILLDTIGELPSVYELAAIVFVGGSIARSGGHNILEPAAVGTCIVTGPHTSNFEAIVKSFVKAGAIVQLQPLKDEEIIADLTQQFESLLNDPARREELARRAAELVEMNRGATERTLSLIEPWLPPKTQVPTPART